MIEFECSCERGSHKAPLEGYEISSGAIYKIPQILQNYHKIYMVADKKALEYFNKTARMDIDDVNGNSRDGIHTACMAGSWMSVVYGFAGFSDIIMYFQGFQAYLQRYIHHLMQG